MITQSVVNFCVRCEARFQLWGQYHAHVTANRCSLKIIPKKTSNRTKAEIVAHIESTLLKGALI